VSELTAMDIIPIWMESILKGPTKGGINDSLSSLDPGITYGEQVESEG
jgi:hypothetical protein